MGGSRKMKYGKAEQMDFIRTQIYEQNRRIEKETDKNKIWALNDIIDMYQSILQFLESRT